MLNILRRFFRRNDPLVLGCAVALSAFSVLLLMGIQQMGVIGRRTVIMQIIAAALGLLLALGLAHLDYERLGGWWKFYVPAAVALMLLTFTPLGQTRSDAIETNRSWLNLGFTTIQPAEFLNGCIDHSFAHGRIGDITGKRNHFTRSILQFFCQRFQALSSACNRNDIGTFLSKQCHNRLSHTGRSAGDDDGFSFQFHS